MAKKPDIMLITGDAQIPFHDERVVSIVEQVAKDLRPRYHVELGDRLDFEHLTTKFLRGRSPIGWLRDDIDTVRRQFAVTTKYCDETIYLIGNHEQRLYNYVLGQAPELQDLLGEDEALSWTNILKLPDSVQIVAPYTEIWEHQSVIFTHGDRHNKYAANAELEDRWSSGVSGHTHRVQVMAHTQRDGVQHAWYSMPAMCNIKGDKVPPGKVKSTSTANSRNQQQGFGVGYFDGEIWNIYPVLVIEGRCIAPWGKRYDA